jgi:hypothetical protein
MVADGGMDGGEFLQTSHPPEAQHRPFSSSEWLVRVLGPIVQPATRFLAMAGTDFPKSGTVGPEPVGYDRFRATMLTHCFP